MRRLWITRSSQSAEIVPVQEVSAEDHGIFRREHGVDPARRDEESVPCGELDALAVLDEVAEKRLILIQVEKQKVVKWCQ